MWLRGLGETGCTICKVSVTPKTTQTIAASVGSGGVNRRDDVLTIQRLLNGVSPADGGPSPLLIEDGLDGPRTNAAILKFQSGQHVHGRTGADVRDDRIDPNGPTLRRLNEVSNPGTRTAALEAAGADRLARVARLFPALRAAAQQGLRAVESAMDYVQLGPDSLFGRSREPDYRRADLYFHFAGQSSEQTLSELSFIRTTLRRLVDVLNGPPPFGLAIFDNDPTRKHPDWIAYSPMQSFDERRTDGTTSGRVYLCDAADQITSDDKLTHILTHELFHFVDDESQARRIVDAAHGYREGALRLTHQQRMHNADNYALFVTHTAIGRERLIASQPTLGPVVPANIP